MRIGATVACWGTILLGGCGTHADRVYTIGTDNTFPYHYVDEAGAAHGMVGDVIVEAARRRGIRLKWEVLPSGPGPSFAEKKVELWPLLARQPELFPGVHFSRPYLRNSYVQVSVRGAAFQPSDGAGAVHAVARLSRGSTVPRR
jgi:hypothetical protein